MPRGRFITLEGGEGAGKSTQTRLLVAQLQTSGRSVVATREPGGSPGAEQLRTLLLSGDIPLAPLAETLLHFAARADHVAIRIAPALAAGTWVVCDRFTDSTLAYQGFGQGVDYRAIQAVADVIGLRPDLTLVLTVRPPVAQARLAARGTPSDRYERLGPGFFARVEAGFQEIAAAEPNRCVVIDASGSVDAVAEAIWTTVQARLA